MDDGKKGYDNLIPFSERTEEEQRKIRQKGGIASGIARRKKSIVTKMLSLPAKDEKSLQALEAVGLNDGEVHTWQEVIIAMQMRKARNRSDTDAAKFLFDQLGREESSGYEPEGEEHDELYDALVGRKIKGVDGDEVNDD